MQRGICLIVVLYFAVVRSFFNTYKTLSVNKGTNVTAAFYAQNFITISGHVTSSVKWP